VIQPDVFYDCNPGEFEVITTGYGINNGVLVPGGEKNIEFSIAIP
jgi:hypothetical protein